MAQGSQRNIASNLASSIILAIIRCIELNKYFLILFNLPTRFLAGCNNYYIAVACKELITGSIMIVQCRSICETQMKRFIMMK
ncbi:hypothetical protein C5167_021313 [Papaver somniferum]|uniref:Uncharacterized protein n=1 Tax=Papaver somniferum TaxID=3469 RepID=A0A4Y7IYX1_PAPSO|nr:hypothetical protein C5167_021313 [Papaver somniferum]